MKKRRIIIVSLALACLMFLFSGCAGEPESLPEPELTEIRVGCDDYTPFSYLDANGQMTGIDVELAEEAFRRIGYKPVFTIINWEDKNSLLESGEIECIWSSFTINGREDEYRWAGPYMNSLQVVAVSENSDIYSLSDLEDKLIAVQSTTKPEEILRQHREDLPEFRRVISVKKRDLIFTMLAKGYVDAAAAHITAVEQFMEECKVSFRILDEPLLEVGLGAAFSLDDDRGIAEELDKTLKEMRKDGTAAQIIGKYLPDPERYLED